MAAEAQYNLALIQYKLGNYKNSETLIHELINQVPSYEYWIASGLILLSDILMQSNNALQAKAILQSIIDNYEGADLKLAAQEKLNAIVAAENLPKAEEIPPAPIEPENNNE
jgi:TolA-binding protein